MRPFTRLPFRQPLRRVTLRTSSRRPLSSSRPLRLKEDKAQDPQEIEKAKQEQLKSGEKKQELESASEQAVGADQEKDVDLKDLQKQSAQQKQKEHPEGKS